MKTNTSPEGKAHGVPGARCVGPLLILIPPLLLLLYIKFFGVNVAYADDWIIVPLIEKMYAGTLSFADLMMQYTTHRILFPKIVTLLLARLTHFNTVATMYFSWALAVATLAMLYSMYRKDFDGSAASLLKFAPVAWLLFSFRQYESILWSFEIQMYLCSSAAVATIFFLDKKGKPGLFAAACCATVASFSSSNGLLAWPVGLIMLLLPGDKRSLRGALLWTVIGASVWMIFLKDFAVTPGPQGIEPTLANPLRVLAFVVLNIGSPLAFMKGAAGGMGGIVCFYLAVAAIVSIRDRDFDHSKWIALAAFSVGSSMILAMGKIGYGLSAALNSRYFPFIVHGVIAAYVLILYLHEKGERTGTGHHAVLRRAMLYGAVLSTIAVGIISGYASGLLRGKEIHEDRTLMVEEIRNYRTTDRERLGRILGNVELLTEQAAFLEKARLNVFRDDAE